ncbi:MAG: hypothetical protein LBM93_15835 [Oscillospiraceae bacterium]|jgi:hypothetical protein|nr:hypothetical protein [Oscillospiraceae bacterium]
MFFDLEVILRSLLYQAAKANTKEEIFNAIKVMCSKEIQDAVKAQLQME